jgi:hypothetical protein
MPGFAAMSFELTGSVPGLPKPLAETYIQQALNRVYAESYWSFQMQTSNWLTPGLLFKSGSSLSIGTITTTTGSTQIVGDADAAAAWVAYAGIPLLTQCQIRSPYYSLYNIIAFDGVDTFTLDRPWMEPSTTPGVLVSTGVSYMIYQAYFPVPVTDFRRFFGVQDFTNAQRLNYWHYSQKDLALIDPQRSNFNLPSYVVPYEVDQRSGSATLGCMLFELWPHPLSILPYTFSFLRMGPQLVNPGDEIPYPLTEELVKWRASEAAALWKEQQKGDGMARGSGADWRFVHGASKDEYKAELKKVRDLDRDMFELYFDRYVRGNTPMDGQPFGTINGMLNLGM